MKWPDEDANREVWDNASGKRIYVAMNRYEIEPGMKHDDVLHALVARTEFLISKIEKLESRLRIASGIDISQGG